MIENIMRRSQAYFYFSHAFLYPSEINPVGESWMEDWPLILNILDELAVEYNRGVDLTDELCTPMAEMDLSTLQSEYTAVFGLAGSLFYETECGLPHEFRQSQELADISGFYRAFGFQVGATVRERPDHLATELEFMYLLTLKEALAVQQNLDEQAQICSDAQRKFLQDHLAGWIRPFCLSLEKTTDSRLGEVGLQSPYLRLARLAEAFLAAEAAKLGMDLANKQPVCIRPTPFNPVDSCAGCAVGEEPLSEQVLLEEDPTSQVPAEEYFRFKYIR
jgi:TorA maturation chaperone TorD